VSRTSGSEALFPDLIESLADQDEHWHHAHRGISVEMDFDSALERALDGESVLFLGAGFSLGATNSRNQPFETGSGFANRLGSAVYLPTPADLQDAAEAFLENRGPAALAKEVLESFRATDVAKFHAMIAAVPWRRVYTTNYDNVYELASAKVGRPFRPVTLSENPGDFDQSELICVHMNGYVERVNSSLGDELKLTDSSYVTASIEASPWATVFRLDLSMAKSVFFVGYSLSFPQSCRVLRSQDLQGGPCPRFPVDRLAPFAPAVFDPPVCRSRCQTSYSFPE
jgi:hypothetical protein